MKYVLAKPYVIRAVRALEAIKSHELMTMYLAIRRQSARGFQDGKPSSETMYEDLKRWLTVPGSVDSQYYRPFVSRGTSFWMNKNLAGSYARSSLRPKTKALFYEQDGDLQNPKPEDVAEVLLKQGASKLPCWAVMGYLYRNASFVTSSSAPTEIDLIQLCKDEFYLYSEDTFGCLFDFASHNEDLPVFDLVDNSPNEEIASGLQIDDESYRLLGREDLEIPATQKAASNAVNPGVSGSSMASSELDERESEILDALSTYSGVILSGSPGTSKSFYANRLAHLLTDGDHERMRFTQFHASYQFEDFIQGYIPNPESGGFALHDGIFLSLCKAAMESEKPHVIVIDELSRGDSCRIFGEALTYIESSKRGVSFYLPSGEQTEIPNNIYIIATMNPIDRGADDVDIAFGRRFATIEMEPSDGLLRARLIENGLEDALRGRLMAWFIEANATCKQLSIPGIGHAFFWDVKDAISLEKTWKWQVKTHIQRSFGVNERERDQVCRMMEGIFN